MKEGNASKLTVNRLQMLNDLGFVFRKMGKTHTWEERMGQLKRYKEEFGHSKVPKSHPELGVFVNRQVGVCLYMCVDIWLKTEFARVYQV